MASLPQRAILHLRPGPLCHRICPSRIGRRRFATGSRGARGHGWYVKYRSSEDRAPNRHLQHEYVEGRMKSVEAAYEWNKAVIELGSTSVYMDLELKHQQHGQEETHRLIIDLATTVIPESTGKFLDLLPRYRGMKLSRYEKKVGWCGGGNFLTRSIDQVELKDPRPLWHLPSTLSMVQRGCINGQFLLMTHAAPHMDGIHHAVGHVRNLEPLQRWASSLLTVKGVPTTHDVWVSDVDVYEGDGDQQP